MMDVGTGTGALSLNFYKYLKSEDRVYNLDISEVMLANLKNKLSQEQILQSSFIVDDAFNFLNKSVQNFHIIGFSGALHHFYDYDKIINLAASKVLPEGYIYIGVEPKNKVIYLERVIRNIESIYYRFRMKEISFLSFLIKICYTPFHFFNKFIYKKEKNQNTINKFDYNLEEQGKTEILHGLDLKLIKTILYQNSFNIIKLQGSPGYIYNFTYRLVNFLKINDHFLLIAKKKYLNKLLIKALDGVI
jgi:ubiquinone/menaquinone biosynthesis C-methylase UbiE